MRVKTYNHIALKLMGRKPIQEGIEFNPQELRALRIAEAILNKANEKYPELVDEDIKMAWAHLHAIVEP